MDKTSGVAAVANALAVMALRAQRSRELREQVEQAREFNRKFEREMSNRSRPVRRNAEHTRMPFILMAGRPSGGGDIGISGDGGMGPSVTQSMPRSLQGSDVPLGYDEGMVRMASAIGSDLALMHEKNAASGLGSFTLNAMAKIHSAAPKALSSGGFARAGRVMGGVASQAGGAIRSGASKAMGAVGNAATSTRNALFGGGVKFKPPAPPKIPTPTPHVAPGVGAPVNSVGMKPPAALKPPATSRPVTAGTPSPQQGGMGTWNKPPAATPKPAQAAVQPPSAPTAPTPQPATPPASSPVTPAPPNQVMAGSAEANARPGATPANAVKETWEDKLRTHVDRARKDLGNGQWKGKGLALAGMAAGTYGAYRGAKALGNFMAKEPEHHASNEGGAIPAYGVNQYGVADRSTPFNY